MTKLYTVNFTDGSTAVGPADTDADAISIAMAGAEAEGLVVAAIHNDDGCVFHADTSNLSPEPLLYTVELTTAEVQTVITALTKLSKRGKVVNMIDLATKIAAQVMPQALANMLRGM